MISVDIVFLQKALRFAHLPWAFPLQLLLSVSFLYSILGMSILQGEWGEEIHWQKKSTDVLLSKCQTGIGRHSAPLYFQLLVHSTYLEANFSHNLYQLFGVATCHSPHKMDERIKKSTMNCDSVVF